MACGCFVSRSVLPTSVEKPHRGSGRSTRRQQRFQVRAGSGGPASLEQHAPLLLGVPSQETTGECANWSNMGNLFWLGNDLIWGVTNGFTRRTEGDNYAWLGEVLISAHSLARERQ